MPAEGHGPGAPALDHWIAGAATPPLSGGRVDDVDPATGEVLARIARGDADDVERAVVAARAALAGPWGRATVEERARVLEAAAAGLEARADALARLESEDTGKPIALARAMDVPRAVANLRFFAGAIRHDETPCHRTDGRALNYTLRRPLGVVGLVTPWNLPLYLLTWKVGPALALGNAVVAKPSELTPRTAGVLAEVLAEAGLPPGALNVVHGLGPEAGQALVEHPDVKALSFTGGTATGARVAATAAPRFKKLSLELGGKNPTLVFADADLEAALDGTVRAGFTNQGQVCLCGSRVLVERAVYADFVDALVARVRALRVGDPRDPEVQLGALVSAGHRDKVEGYLRLAREEGGRVLCGGERPTDLSARVARGAFLTPAVVADLGPACRTVQEEIFGPVVTVHPFEGEAEALALANGVRYGLSASLWTRDLARAHRVAAALEAGMVWVNTWLLRDLRTPFGGLKDSGVGREGGRWSLDFFSDAQNVCVALEGAGPPPAPTA